MTSVDPRHWTRPIRAGIVVVLLLLIAAALLIRPTHGRHRITADFVSAVGVYRGSEVRLMGVPIGSVTDVRPAGDHVRISLEYDDAYRLAAGAKAVIVSPSVVSDRFVQLTPAYDGRGAVLADGAHLALDRTRVPVELDRVFRTAHDLLDALGPQGANDHGAVNRFLGVAADDLRGNGAALGRLIDKLGGAAGTLGAGKDDFFASITALEKLTGALAVDDPQVRAFNTRMERVLGVLADERGSLAAVLDDLAATFGQVKQFVRHNRGLLTSDVTSLVGITDALVAERKALESSVRQIPVGLDNLNRTWDAQLQAVRSRANLFEGLRNIDDFLCDSLIGAGVSQPNTVCAALHLLLGGLAR